MKFLLEICENCGFTFGSHHGGTSPWPRDYCPGHEGRMDWKNGPGTVFEPTGLYRKIRRKKMTSIQACEETKELWTEMARFAREERRLIVKLQVLGPWQNYRNACPCCEYTKHHDCFYCPMFPEWKFYSMLVNAPCEGSKSPYKQWRDLQIPNKSLCIDIEFFCLLIAEMAEEAIEAYR